ncbi:MAG: 50S ribosomal protein L3 [Candidatus Spechtbacterales bacterium]
MAKFILGKKIGMTQIFNEEGAAVAVTIVEAGPCTVTQVKDETKDGYRAVQVGFGAKKLNKPQGGHVKAFVDERGRGFSMLREFTPEAPDELKQGDSVDISQFEVGERVSVAGVSKAKGFQGVVKRHGFAGGPGSHGMKHTLRTPGSIGSAYPQRVLKGRRMAGRMGGVRHTTNDLKIVAIDTKNNLIALKGAIPGNNGSYIEVFSRR